MAIQLLRGKPLKSAAEMQSATVALNDWQKQVVAMLKFGASILKVESATPDELKCACNDVTFGRKFSRYLSDHAILVSASREGNVIALIFSKLTV